MDQNIIKEFDSNIESEINSEVSYLNNKQIAITEIQQAYLNLSKMDVNTLIDKCNYRRECLINAHNYSSVANQEEIEKHSAELNELIGKLKEVTLDIEGQIKSIDINYDEPQYQDYANRIKTAAGKVLDKCNKTIEKANKVLFDKMDTDEVLDEKNEYSAPVEIKAPIIEDKPVEEPAEEITPIERDSIEDIEKALNSELQPIQEDKKELEDTKLDLDQAIKVESVEPAPQSIVEPLLPPMDSPSITPFFNQELMHEENKPVDFNQEKEKMESASSVDDGYVKVEKIETFGLNEEKEQSGPVLSRTA